MGEISSNNDTNLMLAVILIHTVMKLIQGRLSNLHKARFIRIHKSHIIVFISNDNSCKTHVTISCVVLTVTAGSMVRARVVTGHITYNVNGGGIGAQGSFSHTTRSVGFCGSTNKVCLKIVCVLKDGKIG